MSAGDLTILYTGYAPSHEVDGLKYTGMKRFEMGSTDVYPNLNFVAFDLTKLKEEKDLELLRSACKDADVIYHHGTTVELLMKQADAPKSLMRAVHVMIFDEFAAKSDCHNSKVAPDKEPDRKDYHYASVRDAKEEEAVPLITSYSFADIAAQHKEGKVQLPLVLKDPNVDNGWGCLLIETTEQLDKIFNEDLYPSKADFGHAQTCIFQEYIPSVLGDGQVSHARVLVHATAQKIIGMTLFYAKQPQRPIDLPYHKQSLFISHYLRSDSPLCLEAKAVKPTPSARGTIAVYPQSKHSKPVTTEGHKILKAHEITAGEMPPALEKLALTFGRVMAQRGMGGLIGIDVILDPRTKTWRLLEGNFPASGSFRTLFGHGNYESAVHLRLHQVLKAWDEYAAKR